MGDSRTMGLAHFGWLPDPLNRAPTLLGGKAENLLCNLHTACPWGWRLILRLPS